MGPPPSSPQAPDPNETASNKNGFWKSIKKLSPNNSTERKVTRELEKSLNYSRKLTERQEKLKNKISKEISHRNRRLISSKHVKGKLKTEFNDAQQHLNECQTPPEAWYSANPEMCPISYSAEKVGNAGVAHMRGMRPTMEDTHVVAILSVKGKNTSYQIPLYGIFDGHSGDACAKYLEQHIANYLTAHLSHSLSQCNTEEEENAAIFNVLKLTFVNLGAEYRKSQKVYEAGSTANIAIIFKNHLWVANVGDTRAILTLETNTIALSEDAKPGMPKYRKSIESRYNIVRIVEGIPRVGGYLAVARAVGHDEIVSGISPRAKIIKYPLTTHTQEKKFLIIACDGLWDVASSLQVSETVNAIVKNQFKNREIAPEVIASLLVRQAYQAGSTDNISALVVPL